MFNNQSLFSQMMTKNNNNNNKQLYHTKSCLHQQEEEVRDVPNIRNVAIIAHVDVGKTVRVKKTNNKFFVWNADKLKLSDKKSHFVQFFR